MFAIEDRVNELLGASNALMLMNLADQQESSAVGYLADQISTQVNEMNTIIHEIFQASRDDKAAAGS